MWVTIFYYCYCIVNRTVVPMRQNCETIKNKITQWGEKQKLGRETAFNFL